MKNEKKTLTQWFLLHYGTAMNIAFSFSPSYDMANDILQSAFIEFIEEAEEEHTQVEKLKLLRKVLRRVAQRFWDEKYRNSPEKIEKIARHLSSLAQEEFETKNFEEELFALRKCLEKLSEKSRKLIEEHYFMGNTVKTISEQFGVSSRAVYKAICTIRNKLRDCINAVLKMEGIDVRRF